MFGKKHQHTLLHVQEISTREKGGGLDVRMQADMSVVWLCLDQSRLHSTAHVKAKKCARSVKTMTSDRSKVYATGSSTARKIFAHLKTLRDTERLPSKVFLKKLYGR